MTNTLENSKSSPLDLESIFATARNVRSSVTIFLISCYLGKFQRDSVGTLSEYIRIVLGGKSRRIRVAWQGEEMRKKPSSTSGLPNLCLETVRLDIPFMGWKVSRTFFGYMLQI